MRRTIRVWDGCKVVALLEVSQDGSVTFSGDSGGAACSLKADIELDPFAGLLVEHSLPYSSPIAWREVDR